jgi:ketosteroid isomerase-like protein
MSPTTAETGLTQKDETMIRAIIEPWTRACLERDWDALLGMCADDVAFSPPNEPLVQGDSVRPWLDGFPEIKAMAWDIDYIEGAGDLAWLRGWVRMTLALPGQVVTFDGKYTDVARKQPDGSWRFALVMWSSNEAAPGTP